MTAHPPIEAWCPLAPDELVRVFEPIGARWWIAGGVAIDLHVGRTTRPHGDVDVAMLRTDYPCLTDLFRDFDLYIAYDGTLIPWHGEPLRDEHHQFWAGRTNDDAWAFEVLLEQTDGNDWLYRRDPRLRRAVAEFGTRDARGVPHVRPEIALLYKSNKPALDRNAHDFDVALPSLAPPERAWLADALRIISPEHPWRARLDA
ncbi:MAG TPA: amino acid transporter [Dehalococcoidia bacterium]|nr:amino acid transporter [Dehalococcoidia bacterium]